MSDLFGNHIVGFPTRWLILSEEAIVMAYVTTVTRGSTYRVSSRTRVAENIPNSLIMLIGSYN